MNLVSALLLILNHGHSFWSRIWWSRVLKATDRSRGTNRHAAPLSMASRISDLTLMNAVSIEWNFLSAVSLCASAWWTYDALISFFSILDMKARLELLDFQHPGQHS